MPSIPPASDAVAHVEEALVQWVYPQRKRLTSLVEAGTFDASELKKTLEKLTEAAAETLHVERTSIWRILPDGSGMECLHLYERTSHRHSGGPVITAESAPNYFKAIAGEQVIAAHDARTDPRTSEFRDAYLVPLDITAMLDAPVFVRGVAVAVICHEHVGGARTWQFWEELVASTFADFVAMALDAESRVRDVVHTRAQEAELQKLVAERTLALSESEKNLQALLDAAPIPLALLRAVDRRLIYANQRALELFDADPNDLPQLADTREFWVHQEDRSRFASRLLAEGSLDDAEVELRSTKGRTFWARMNAKAMRFRGELTLVASMLDISEERRAKEALKQNEQHLRTLLEAAPSPLLVTGRDDGLVRYANAPALALFDVTESSFLGRPAPEYFVDATERRAFLSLIKREGRAHAFSAQLRTHSGRKMWVLMNSRASVLDGESVYMTGLTELTAQKELEQKLRELATKDELTGAYNRRYFFDHGEIELRRTLRYHLSTSLAMVDVDYFKQVNDRYGHAAGDSVLREIATILREQVRTTDIVARIGGEEFALLFPETPMAGAEVTVERIRRAVSERSFEGLPPGVRVTISVGLVEHHLKDDAQRAGGEDEAPRSQRGESLGEFLRRADECLYLAKNEGRNRVSVRPRSHL